MGIWDRMDIWDFYWALIEPYYVRDILYNFSKFSKTRDDLAYCRPFLLSARHQGSDCSHIVMSYSECDTYLNLTS